MFVCLGQTKFKEILASKTAKPHRQKVVSLAYVCDERICDGYYFAKTFQLFQDYMNNPELLETPPKAVKHL
jgi:hypothetical protein